MELASTTPATALPAAPGPASAPAATAAGTGQSGRVIASDFETFLKMLTVQMENQDPLNPIDSADYAVQLATFSGVEQQVQTNDLLRGLAAQMGVSGLAQMAGWVGKEVRLSGPVPFDGAPVTLMTPASRFATRAELVVRDATGQEVQRLPAPLDATEISWTGTTAEGQSLPPGQYAFSLDSYVGDSLLGTVAIETYARVTEVRLVAGQTMLVLPGGSAVPATAVTALRAP